MPESLLEIEGEIAWPDFQAYRAQAIKNLGENMEMPGFRKGHIPENILLKHVSEVELMQEMAELAMPKAYLSILEENKIDAIGRPEIAITKLVRDNPLGFKIKTAVLPEIKLPDYKEIAKAENKEKFADTEVSQEEIDKTILQLRKMRFHPKEGEEVKDEDLPALDDDFVKSLGNFNDVEDFKLKLKENIRLEKEAKEREKRRIKIIEAISGKAKIDLPRILVESELDKMLYQVKSDIETSGFKFEDYLKHIGKTEEDMKKEWEKDAEKRAKLELILREIGRSEKIQPDEKEVKAEVDKLLNMYKDAEPARARSYVENLLTNEKIFQLLENQ